MNYRIISVSGTRIYLKYEDDNEIDGALELMSSISAELIGNVVMVGPHNNMFEITNDPMHLRFQWIARQGLIVIVQKVAEVDKAVEFLKKHIDKLN